MNNAVDRLSGLPSPLLDHILSFLPTKDVVQTCVLSKSWRNVWCYVSSFHFDDGDFSGVEDFLKFVDSALFLRDGSTIRKLRLSFSSKDSISDYTLCRANKWIIYAIRHNVEVIDISNIHLRGQWTSPFGSTSQISTCQSLRELRLTSYPPLLKLPASCWLPSLKFLQFSNSWFMDVQMTTFDSSAFPSLETLVMQNCMFESNKLRISFPKLKNLNFKGGSSWLGNVLEISADTPNLISLELELTYERVEFVEFNVISLVIANINLSSFNLDSLTKLIRALESVRSLTLRAGNLVAAQNVRSILASIQTPFYNMKWLKIQTSFSDGDICMINTLLKHSTELETLFLEHEVNAQDTTAEHRFEAEEVWFKYKLPHLKLVEIQGFRGSVNEVKFAKFILEHAIVLDNLIITTSKSEEEKDNKQLMNTGRKLLASPRVSPSVGILFN